MRLCGPLTQNSRSMLSFGVALEWRGLLFPKIIIKEVRRWKKNSFGDNFKQKKEIEKKIEDCLYLLANGSHMGLIYVQCVNMPSYT